MAEYLGYPRLKREDITSPFLRESLLGEALVKTRMGRVVVIFDHIEYQRFLSAVKAKYGSISHRNVNEAAKAAIMEWVKRVEHEDDAGGQPQRGS
ncbi:MAG: hypothetical protein DRN96_06790 [Thermoproteota archaeon]|nr:MAG: hypothetical protein DRN96_06790 [Candidatus Korarchaeota archaeon]RLG55667.1 MAG: hypothetical protein DRN99_01940 [Candidatus Korarchaeota archaeon]